jgi:hypothetical protein
VKGWWSKYVPVKDTSMAIATALGSLDRPAHLLLTADEYERVAQALRSPAPPPHKICVAFGVVMLSGWAGRSELKLIHPPLVASHRVAKDRISACHRHYRSMEAELSQLEEEFRVKKGKATLGVAQAQVSGHALARKA